MKQIGHAGMALAWAAPLAIILGIAASPLLAAGAAMIALSVASLPDTIDFSTELITHRGGTHTVWFGFIVAIIAGLVVMGGLSVATDSAAAIPDSPSVTAALSALPSPVVGGTIAAVSAFLGVASHLFADALTVGRGSNLIRPLWPISNRELYYGFTKYDNYWWNYSLFAAGVLCQIVVFAILVQTTQPLQS